MNLLKKKNPHARDTRISFEDEGHIYTITDINGKKHTNYLSVTTFNSTHFPKFNSDLVINKMMESRYWNRNKYFSMTKQEILDKWEKIRISASFLGTKLHNDIEKFYNKIEVNNNSKEFKYFLNFYKDNSWRMPFRTEMMIFDDELKIAGSIDMLYKNSDNSFSILDWKRSKEIKFKSFNNEKALTKCINHLENTNFNKYSLQLNLYKKILEKNYGYKITEMKIVQFHPNFSNYKEYDVKNLTKEIEQLCKERLEQLEEKEKEDDEEEYEEINCIEKKYKNKIFLIDDLNNIIDEDGYAIGIWKKNKPSLY